MMLDRPTECPENKELAAIIADEWVDESISTHVSSCARCRRQLAALRA